MAMIDCVVLCKNPWAAVSESPNDFLPVSRDKPSRWIGGTGTVGGRGTGGVDIATINSGFRDWQWSPNRWAVLGIHCVFEVAVLRNLEDSTVSRYRTDYASVGRIEYNRTDCAVSARLPVS